MVRKRPRSGSSAPRPPPGIRGEEGSSSQRVSLGIGPGTATVAARPKGSAEHLGKSVRNKGDHVLHTGILGAFDVLWL